MLGLVAGAAAALSLAGGVALADESFPGGGHPALNGTPQGRDIVCRIGNDRFPNFDDDTFTSYYVCDDNGDPQLYQCDDGEIFDLYQYVCKPADVAHHW